MRIHSREIVCRVLVYSHLPVWSDLAEDLPDLGLETHVQHPVRLVQHHVGAPTEVCLAHLREWKQL